MDYKYLDKNNDYRDVVSGAWLSTKLITYFGLEPLGILDVIGDEDSKIMQFARFQPKVGTDDKALMQLKIWMFNDDTNVAGIKFSIVYKVELLLDDDIILSFELLNKEDTKHAVLLDLKKMDCNYFYVEELIPEDILSDITPPFNQ